MLSMRIALALLLSLSTSLHARISPFRAPLGAATTVAVAEQTRAPTPDVHFVPTPTAVVDAMLELANVTSSDVVYDLGSGDGRIVIAAAQKFGARGVGIELDTQLVSEAKKKARKAGVADKVTFISNRSFQGGHFRGDGCHIVLVALDQPEASAETDAGTQTGHAHCLAQVRHGRLEAGAGTDSPRRARVPLDHS